MVTWFCRAFLEKKFLESKSNVPEAEMTSDVKYRGRKDNQDMIQEKIKQALHGRPFLM